MTTDSTQWLLDSDEPWTRYRTLVDLLDCLEDDPEVQAARASMLAHPQIQTMMAETATWGERPLKRHNDASHPIYKFSTLADFGVRADDVGMAEGIEAVLAHQAAEGAFQTLVNIPKTFGGTGEDMWTWILCDSPTLLYTLLKMGLGDDPRVQQAVNHLVDVVDDNGWRCVAAPELGKFKGPGRRSDPCPIALSMCMRSRRWPKSRRYLTAPPHTPARRCCCVTGNVNTNANFLCSASAPIIASSSIPLFGTTSYTWWMFSADFPLSMLINVFRKWYRSSPSKPMRPAATPPIRCIRVGKTGHSPTKKIPRRGSRFWCCGYYGG
jgi:hypothetical protein